jgi:hypothetical protein
MLNKKNIYHHFGEQANLSGIFKDFFYYFKSYSIYNHYIYTNQENLEKDEINIFHYHKLHNDHVNFVEKNSLCTIHHKLDSYLPFWNGVHWIDNIKNLSYCFITLYFKSLFLYYKILIFNYLAI